MFRRLTLLRAMRTLLVAVVAVVCLTPAHAQKLKQPVATVLDFNGQVSIKDSHGGMEHPVSLSLVVHQTEVIITGVDGWARFQYSDGSTFEIFPKSTVVFQEHPADFEHLLNVWIGHVKVWIQHAPGVPNYKNVQTPTAVISVRGTVFSVDVQDEDTTVVSVEEGLVDVRNITVPVVNVPRLGAGQSITVIRNQQLGLNRGNSNGLWAKAMREIEDAAYRVILIARGNGGIGLPGGPIGTTGGAQGDKGKTTGTGTGASPGAPSAPSAPTPPPAPPPPGGGH
jgi:hypothetical protein